MEQYNPSTSSFSPLKTPTEDLQLEFQMLDPYYRVFLDSSATAGLYSTAFRVPDRLGVYKFRLSHWRYGFSFIDEELEVSVIQFRHDEFPRFLPIAYPYYITVFLIMGATFVFVASFLYGEYSVGGQKKKEK